MSLHKATIRWSRGDDEFIRQRYSRGHTWHFDEGVTVPASAAPGVVKPPLAVEAAVDPEEALVAALSSCHMLYFLSYLSRAGHIVERYEDAADGLLEKRADGKMAITKVTIRPVVTVRAPGPTPEEFAKFHHDAHEECIISNTVNCEVSVEPELQIA
jgi:organic hydroperoxide reductase OsmC/OhrA